MTFKFITIVNNSTHGDQLTNNPLQTKILLPLDNYVLKKVKNHRSHKLSSAAMTAQPPLSPGPLYF